MKIQMTPKIFVALRKRALASTCFAAVGLLALSGCTTFRGPGELTPLASSASYSDQGNDGSSGEAASDSEEASNMRFEWPVDQARMTRGFLTTGRGHWGLDLANKRGTPILAAESGVVIYAGKGFRGYGKLVVIEHNNEWATFYAHLHRIDVKEGQRVKVGQKLGAMGRTGRASGVHLHFEVRHKRQPVNPLAHLPESIQTQRVVIND